MGEDWVSLSEAARRRGVSHTAWQKAIKTGRVKAESVRRGKAGHIVSVEYHSATAQWDANTDLDQSARNGKVLGAADHSPDLISGAGDAVAPATTPPGGDKDLHGYYDARAGLARAQRQRAELDNLERAGTLVSAEDVRGEQFSIFRQHRDKLEQLPINISERLAAETDPQRVEHLLRTAIRSTLNELSRGLAIDDAAVGAAGGTSVTA